MKKILCVIFLVMFTVITTACAMDRLYKTPESGVWWCEELGISLDFSKKGDPYEIATKLNDAGETQKIVCHFGYGRDIHFSQADEYETHILSGDYTWKDDAFTVKDYHSDKEYVFVEIVT